MARKALYKREKPKWWSLVCLDCQKQFKSYSVKGKAQYCPECLLERRRKAGSHKHEPKKAICELCKEPYVATGRAQKYCKDCQKKKDYETTRAYRAKKKMEHFWKGTSPTRISREYALNELKKVVKIIETGS